MRVSGFTIAKEAVRFGYPLEESLRSLSPLVDELIVGVGDGDDGTWELVQSLGDPKIQAFRSVWDLSQRENVLSQETNKALERCSGDWAIYLQADEVLHEAERPTVRAALDRYHASSVEGLSFRYLHFYGSYRTVQDHPGSFYRRATRAIRNRAGIRSVGDAAGFFVFEKEGTRRLRRANISAHVFHYGWARPPQIMARKQIRLREICEGHCDSSEREVQEGIYSGLGHLRYFRGEHPAVMTDRIARQDWSFDPKIEEQPPRWLRLARVYLTWPRRHLKQSIHREAYARSRVYRLANSLWTSRR